jgi:hypothetical protein
VANACGGGATDQVWAFDLGAETWGGAAFAAAPEVAPGCDATSTTGRASNWVGGFQFRGPGIHLYPPESDPLPNPSESGIHFDRVKMPIHTAKYVKEIPPNPPESNHPPISSESGNAIPACYASPSHLHCQPFSLLSRLIAASSYMTTLEPTGRWRSTGNEWPGPGVTPKP